MTLTMAAEAAIARRNLGYEMDDLIPNLGPLDLELESVRHVAKATGFFIRDIYAEVHRIEGREFPYPG